ncbi:MAG: hypothetical protein ACT4N4_10730, partial [Rhodospirillales bacterium]
MITHPLALRALSFALVFGAWEYAGASGISAGFPSFSETLIAAGAMIADGSLPRAVLITLQPLVVGIAVSALVGVSSGVAMGLSRRAEWLGLPLFVVMQAAPLAAL